MKKSQTKINKIKKITKISQKQDGRNYVFIKTMWPNHSSCDQVHELPQKNEKNGQNGNHSLQICKSEQPPKGLELQKYEEDKDEKHIR